MAKKITEVEDKNNSNYPVWRRVRNKDCKDIKKALVTHETIKSGLKYVYQKSQNEGERMG